MKYKSPDGKTTIKIESPSVGATLVTQVTQYEDKEDHTSSMLLDRWELNDLVDKIKTLRWSQLDNA
jgi:hypothetical protein